MDDTLLLAARDAQHAIAAGTADGHDLMMLALYRAETGDLAAAEASIAEACALEPDNPSVLVGLAIIRHREGRLRDAVIACDKAIAIAPDYPDAWRERGAILAAGGSNQAAKESFLHTLGLAPRDTAALAGLAALAAREGDFASARRHAETALRYEPANLIASCALASAELAEGGASRVPSLLDPVISATRRASNQRSLAHTHLGNAYKKLGEYEKAFASFTAANSDFAEANRDQSAKELGHTEFVRAIESGLNAFGKSNPTNSEGRQPELAAGKHIFLIGYPRSGTTLAENILASLPGVAALEERPTLRRADEDYLSGTPSEIFTALARFADADEEILGVLRTAYWEKVASAGISLPCPAFVDMDPLKGTRLPLIARLFPDARILVMRRDPRDVVWSCFHTNFAATSGTLEYTTLAGAAQHYDAMMSLMQRAFEMLPLSFQEVRYEALVSDFEAETRRMCSFAGIEWSDTVFQFDKTAKRRGVSTASVAQVQSGLFDGRRQWEPFARWLEPVMPILSPWITKFGYAI